MESRFRVLFLIIATISLSGCGRREVDRTPPVEQVKGPAGPEHANGHQHGHEVGDDPHRDVEPLLGPLDEGLVDRHPSHHGATLEGVSVVAEASPNRKESAPHSSMMSTGSPPFPSDLDRPPP